MNPATTLKNQRGGVLKVILIILGVLALLFVVAAIGIGIYVKKSGGVQGLASQVMAKGVEMLQPQLEKTLSPEDTRRFEESLAILRNNVGELSPEQIQKVSEAVQKLGQDMQGGKLSETDAKKFVDDFSAAVHPPVPAMQ